MAPCHLGRGVAERGIAVLLYNEPAHWQCFQQIEQALRDQVSPQKHLLYCQLNSLYGTCVCARCVCACKWCDRWVFGSWLRLLPSCVYTGLAQRLRMFVFRSSRRWRAGLSDSLSSHAKKNAVCELLLLTVNCSTDSYQVWGWTIRDAISHPTL